jgi:hypothetical protein
MHGLLSLALRGVFTLVISAISSIGANVHAAPGAAAEQAAAWQAVQNTVRTACKEDADCRTVGVGVRACGGPQQYLPWSTRSTSAKRLKVAVQRYNQTRRAQIERDGENSTCALLPEPAVACVVADSAKPLMGHCSLRAAAEGER